MILIVGGAAAGKLEYVKSLGYGDQDIAHGVLDQRPVLYALQDLLAACPQADQEALLARLEQKPVVVCDEIGCGVIPADPALRELRELTGRLCLRLAAKADKVVRLVCGLPQVVKG